MAWVRLTLLMALASSQITLYWRSGGRIEAFAIMAAVSWLGGALLLYEREEEGVAQSRRIPPLRFLLGVLLVLWCLLVLSLASRLYDPLLHGVTLVGLVGVALLSGVRLRSRLTLELALLGSLLPLQVLVNRFAPTGWLATSTAQVGAGLLWIMGQPAVARGIHIELPETVLEVGASCTGLNTLVLCTAALLMLQLVCGLGPPLWRSLLRWSLILGLSLAAAYGTNALRVALLGLADHGTPEHWWQNWNNFDFWHDGGGSHLFSLLAMTLAVWIFSRIELAGLEPPEQAP
jgi:exosortase/archaeosortase family protein